MARIKRTPPKRLSSLPADVQAFATSAATCPEDDLPRLVGTVDSWPFPKTDFFHWIDVLNRFDSRLESLIQEYGLKTMQTKDFTPSHKSLLLAMLNLTNHLWKNCTNRSLYSSYEHLNELVYSRDLDVLAATIRLILRPAQRLGSQRSIRNTLGVAQERITILAQHWRTKQYGLNLDQLMDDDTVIPAECSALHFQFYRSEKKGLLEDAAQEDRPTASTPAKSAKAAGKSAESTDKQAAGLTVIQIPDVSGLGKSDRDLLLELVEKYRVPVEHQFPLLQKIRIALGIKDVVVRRKLLAIRIMSIAVLVILGTEEIIQSKLFTFEPELIQQLAELLQKDAGTEAEAFEVQAACLYALDSMAHHRNRVSEVLTAVSASANHGILMFVLRKVISSLDTDNPIYPQEFIDALFGFVGYIASTQSGGNMIISAGVLPILIQLMTNARPEQMKPVTKCIILLDSLVFGFTTSFAPFTAANGLEFLVRRIKDEVNTCLAIIPSTGVDTMDTVSGPTADDLPHDRTMLLRSLLKFVLHMMQTSGTADRMRNLIDTTLPSSLLIIFEQTQLFGASVFGLAVNVMSTFIHNEPTCLSILQEAKLPQALLEAISKNVPISAEVISALPNAFGAICLNQQGLDQFNEARPIGKYLEVLTSEEHIRTLQDNDVPHLVGNSMDELIRHHPTLKDYVMAAIIEMLERVVAIGQEVSPDDPDTSSLQTVRDVPIKQDDDDERKEPRVSQFIDLVARFLEGLFQNVAHCKDFIKMNGVNILLKCYSLPTLPYDFASSPSSYSLSYLFRLMIEVNSQQVVGSMLNELQNAVEAAAPLLEFQGEKGLVASFIELKETDTERIREGERVFRSLITLQGFIRLLSDIYCTHVLSHNKSVAALIQTFSGDFGGKLIDVLGSIYRTCVWENLLLKDSVPKTWYQASKNQDKMGITRGSLAASLLDGDVLDAVLDAPASSAAAAGATAGTEENEEQDPRVKNTRYFKHLLTQIPTVLTPTLQGVLKVLTSRRIADPTNRQAGQVIVDDIALLLRNHLTWERPERDSSINKYSYLAVVLGFASVMFLEDRNGLSLHTNLVVAFYKIEGTQRIFDVTEKLWNDIDQLSQRPEVDTDPKLKEMLSRTYVALELALNILQTLCNGKMVHDSPLTGNMMSREKDKMSPDYFDPYDYVTEIRSRIAPLVQRIWHSSFLQRAPASIVKVFLAIVTHLMKAEGEISSRTEAPAPNIPSLSGVLPGLAASLFNRSQPLVADEEKLQQLIDMGFPRAAAEHALIRCGNHVGRAAEYLLTHPNIVATASYGTGSASTPTSATAATPTATDSASAPAPVPTSSSESTDATGTGEPSTSTETPSPDAMDVTEDAEELAAALAMSMDTGDSPDTPAADATSSATPMDVDPAPETEATSKDKGKAKEVDTEQLDSIRKELRAEIPQSSLTLLDHVEEVIFSVKELFCLVGKDDIPGAVGFLVTEIERIRGLLGTDAKDGAKQLAIRLRLFALIVSDTIWQKAAIESSQILIGGLLEMTGSDGLKSPWLSSVLLVLESYLSLSDEPKAVPLKINGETKALENTSEIIKPLSAEERSSLLRTLLSLLALDSLDKEMLHAVLRLAVRLTRQHGIAIEFAQQGGIPLLFNPKRIGLFAAQPAMTVMILRHIIDDAEILKSTLERELVHWFSHPRARVAEIATFIRNNSHLISRDPEAFVKAVTEVCMLPRLDSAGKPSQICLQPNEEPEKDSPKDELSGESATVKPIDDQAMDIDGVNKDNAQTLAAAAATDIVKSVYASDVSETVVQFLVSALLSLKTSSGAGSPSDLAPPLSIVAGSGSSDKTADAEKTPVAVASPEKEAHIQRCFLLQCLSELVVAYPTCKVDLINASQRKTGKNGTPHKHSSSRNPFLSYLVQDLLPHQFTAPTDPVVADTQRGIVESGWTTSLISGLCVGVTADLSDERKLFPDLANVRRCVLDVVARCLRDTINHAELTTSVRYARFAAISDLSYKVLTARGPASGTGSLGAVPPGHDDIPTHVARMMLEKGFVNLFTQALAEVDIHHPQSSKLIDALLKPTEFLTKLAIKLGKTPEPRPGSKSDSSKPSAAPDGDQGAVDAPMEDAMLSNGIVPMEEAEVSDIYRNSALGMYHAPTSDEEMDQASSEDSDDEGYDDFTGEDMSEGDDMDDEDEGSDVDDDMEIVVPQPYQGNPEPSSEDEDDDENDDDDDDDADIIEDGLNDDDRDAVPHHLHPDESDSGGEWDDNHMMDYHDLTGGHAQANEGNLNMATGSGDLDDEDEHDEDDDQGDSEGEAVDALDPDEDESDEDSIANELDIYDGEDEYTGEVDEENEFMPIGGQGGNGFRMLPRLGGLFGGHTRGGRTRRTARRPVMEVDMAPGGGLDFQWVPDEGVTYNTEASEFQVLGRPLGGGPPRPQVAADDTMAHPLLVNQGNGRDPRTDPTAFGGRAARGTAGVRAGDVMDWNAFDELIGGNALQILESLFYRPRAGAAGGVGGANQFNRVDVGMSDYPGGLAAPGSLVGGLPMPGQRAPISVSTEGAAMVGVGGPRPTGSTERPLIDEQVAVIHAFAPMGTAERWWQEARLMYGSSVSEKGARVANAVANALLPAAEEAAKKRKADEERFNALMREAEAKQREAREEEEKRKKAEEEELRKKAEEEARVAAEAAAAAAAEAEAARIAAGGATEEIAAEAAPEDQMDVEAPAVSETPAEEPRVVITVNGTEYDITGSGIDVTFLEALPADLQQDVIDEHLRNQRRSRRTAEVPPDISAEFLDALPDDLRDEVLAQQRREVERQARARAAAETPASSAARREPELDPASFLATLDPALRQSVLSEQDDGFLASLPPALAAEANAFRGVRNRSRLMAFQGGRATGSGAGPGGAAAILANLENIPKNAVRREAVHLLDKAALITLVRMLFLPEPVGLVLLHRTLVNLCENSKTRTELVSLLLSILADGSSDLAAVDKSFSQLSLKGKGKYAASTPRKAGTNTPAGTPSQHGTTVAMVSAGSENVPNLVAQRCLEALSQMIVFNEAVARLFLMETDLFSTTFTRTPKKGKGKDKEKAADYKYPVNVLLSLLQRPAFLNSTVLMERLMHILSMILRLLSMMNLNRAKELVVKQEAELAAAQAAATALLSESGPTLPGEASAATASTDESATSTLATATPKKPAATSASPTTAVPTVTEFKSPVIPDQYVSAVVNVLTAGVCSGKSFQYTLSVVQHLFSLSHNRETITRELAEAAQRLGDAMVPDLDELIAVLKAANSAVEVQNATLGKFTQASAMQAKLLRVLKTIDFTHSKGKAADIHAVVTAASASASAAVTPGTATPAGEMAGAEGSTVPSSDDVLAKAKETLREESEKRLLAIYDTLQLPKLWQRLGSCLTLINDKDILIHVATVLLPAIESFMVVSKPYVLKKRPATAIATSAIQAPPLSRVSTSQIAELSNEELFVAFTEEHRKILNTMVRNSPSLMSGSFSLLVHNPKVLEFDNKRTYFNQQLHKRTSRDHYGPLQINVRRQYVFEDSYHQLQGRSGDEIKLSKLNVRFYEEEGVDAGGVTREWFSVLARQMFNPDYALFRPSAVDKVTYQPNRLSGINPDHLLYFKFVGRVIGKAIYDGRLLDAYFTRSFYKAMIDAPVDYKDMEAVDPEFHKSLEWMLQNDITDVFDLTFSTEIDEFGKKQTIDLLPDGRNMAVTEANKNDYVRLIVEQRLLTAIRAQIQAFLGGFHDVIPQDLVKIFNEQELELLISGMPDIDIDDWKNNTEYQNYTQASPQVQWFWRAVRSFSQEERAKLVQFATGTSKVPLEGFAQLQGSNGVQKFQIHKDFSNPERLPSAHTCFNQLDLPLYESYEQLRERLLIAISEGATGFGFV
ncbi:hypothetical protein HKX48_001941 [Thoreauomyces humboldtii]|nr:hypothetical protein HKX48_001941 [Thoreauomyces humboldtii]